MVKMLRHKQTGELFIYTPLLAGNNILEPVVEDPIQEVMRELKESSAESSQEAPRKAKKVDK